MELFQQMNKKYTKKVIDSALNICLKDKNFQQLITTSPSNDKLLLEI